MDTENVVKTPSPSVNYQKIFRLVGLAIIAVIILAVVISIIGLFVPDKFQTPGKNYVVYEVDDDKQAQFIFNGKKPIVVEDDITEEITVMSGTFDQEYVVFLTQSNELYVVNKKGVEKVAEEVTDFKLSAFGDTILFINEDGDLYSGEVAKADKAKKIDSDVAGINAISPDGSAFAYTCVDEDDDEKESDDENSDENADTSDDFFGFGENENGDDEDKDEDEESSVLDRYLIGDVKISKNGKKGEAFEEKDAIVFAISNDAKYVYYVKDSGYYTAKTNKDDAVKLADIEDTFTPVSMNRDGTQLIYNARTLKSDKNDEIEFETKTYMVRKAKERLSLEKGSATYLLAPEGSVSYTFGDFAALSFNSDENISSVLVYNVNSFADCVIAIDDNYYLIKNTKGDTEKLSELKNTSPTMLEDGKTVVFVKNNTLKTYDVTKYKKDATEYELDEDISTFGVSADGKHIYVKDTDNTLYYVKSEKKMKKVEDDVSSYRVLNNGKVYYITEDRELYYANKSDNGKKVLSDEVKSFVYYSTFSQANDVYVVTEDAFYEVNGKKAEDLFNID